MDLRPIGVFDSGSGGLTAVREIRSILPSENIIYFGDTSRVPYGSRSAEILLRFARQDIRFLRTFDIKALLVACGTVSTTSLPQLQAESADLPLLGEVPELQPLLHGHRAAVRGFNTGNNLHEGGFSAAIDADKPHALTILQHEGCVAEDFICTETFLYALQGEQNHRKSPPGGGIIRADAREGDSPCGGSSS